MVGRFFWIQLIFISTFLKTLGEKPNFASTDSPSGETRLKTIAKPIELLWKIYIKIRTLLNEKVGLWIVIGPNMKCST